MATAGTDDTTTKTTTAATANYDDYDNGGDDYDNDGDDILMTTTNAYARIYYCAPRYRRGRNAESPKYSDS